MKADLLMALSDPSSVAGLAGGQWTTLLRQARQTRAMSKLAHRLAKAGVEASLDGRVVDHLIAARTVADRHRASIRWEANRILAALENEPCDVIFLKGGAYILAGMEAGQGRLVSDIDIMVPKAHLEQAERRLLDAGWEHLKLRAYDQRYYRQWMHELPPMRHEDRKNVVDLHHTILPETGRVRLDPRKLFDAAIRIPGLDDPRAKMLCPADMVLHSAAHLFQDGDLAGGLRDLLDLDDLLRDFSTADAAFWPALLERARELGLSRPLFYALRFTHQLLATPVPAQVLSPSQADGPAVLIRWLMDRLTLAALTPSDTGQDTLAGDLARWLLYVRSHWLRMPPSLLAKHLSTKALMRCGWLGEEPSQPSSQQGKADPRDLGDKQV